MADDSKISPTLQVRGFEIYKGLMSSDQQSDMVDTLRYVAKTAPFVQPVTPSGKKMSVQMTAAGALGWVTDRKGYRYQATHPNGSPWPDIPTDILTLWRSVTGLRRDPNSCLINLYRDGARMGLHQDRDEGDFSWPVVSISLGDEALFRIGGTERRDRTQSLWLTSGDVVVMGGEARLAFHGIDRIKFGSSQLLSKGGRINLTLRVVDL